MVNVTFLSQRDKQFKRQVSLLRLLNINPSSLSTTELANLLNVSPPTLKKDIDILNSAFSKEYGKFYITPKSIVTMKHFSHVSVDSMIAKLGKETIVYKLMTNLLNNIKWTVLQATQNLGCSRSVLLQIIRYMNDGMKIYNVSISTKSIIGFVGSESDIRFYLFAFFSTFGETSIIGENSESDAKNIVAEYENLISPRLHLSHYRMSIWISISKTRWKHQLYVSLKNRQEIEKSIVNKENFIKFERLMNEKLESQNMFSRLPRDEKLWAYFITLHCVSYSNEISPEQVNANFILRRDEYPDIIFTMHQFLKEIFSQEMIENGYLEKIEAFLVNIRLLSMITPTFEMAAPELRRFIQETHWSLYSMWLEKLQVLNDRNYFSFTHLNDLAITLTLIHISIDNQKKPKILKILYAFQGPAGFDDYLVSITKRLFPDYIKVYYFLERAVTKESIQKTNIDLVVCNYDLQLINFIDCPIVRLSNTPTSADWEILRDMVYRLSNPHNEK